MPTHDLIELTLPTACNIQEHPIAEAITMRTIYATIKECQEARGVLDKDLTNHNAVIDCDKNIVRFGHPDFTIYPAMAVDVTNALWDNLSAYFGIPRPPTIWDRISR